MKTKTNNDLRLDIADKALAQVEKKTQPKRASIGCGLLAESIFLSWLILHLSGKKVS